MFLVAEEGHYEKDSFVMTPDAAQLLASWRAQTEMRKGLLCR